MLYRQSIIERQTCAWVLLFLLIFNKYTYAIDKNMTTVCDNNKKNEVIKKDKRTTGPLTKSIKEAKGYYLSQI